MDGMTRSPRLGTRKFPVLTFRIRIRGPNAEPGQRNGGTEMPISSDQLPFGDVLEAFDRFTLEEQKDLAAILQRRVAERRRKQLAEDIHQARQESGEGGCRPMTVDELMLIVGQKVGNTLIVAGEEFRGHQDHPPDSPGGGSEGNTQ